MYDVVGCDRCSMLWIRSGEAESASCPRCGKRHQVNKLQPLARTESADSAREARSRLLADRQLDDADSVAGFAAIADEAAEEIISAEDHLDSAGIDSVAVKDAGDRAIKTSPRESHTQIIRRIILEQGPIEQRELVSRAEKHGVTSEKTQTHLENLIERGAVLQTVDGYRLL